MTIETEHNIGDTVYHVSEYGYDKDIIRAIRVTGEKHQTIEYGFRVKDSFFMNFSHGDGFSWYRPAYIFTGEERAARYADSLKAKREQKEKTEKEQSIIQRKAKLKAELEQLDAGIDPNEIEEDY